MPTSQTLHELERRIRDAAMDCQAWRASGHIEKYMEAYDLVEALQLQLLLSLVGSDGEEASGSGYAGVQTVDSGGRTLVTQPAGTTARPPRGPTMYQRILVPIDGSPTSDRGVEEAAHLALLTRGRIRLMHVLDEISVTAELEGYAGSMGDWIGELRSNANTMLQCAAANVRAMGVEATTLLQDGQAGPIHEPIVTEALLWQADLIVVGTHGRHGLKRLYLGSGAESILRHAPVPVLLVRYVAETPPVNASFELPHLVPVPA